jgi:benzoate-CoA ligase family protein
MSVEIPDRFNLAQYFLTARIEEGQGERVALRIGEQEVTYAEVETLACRYARALRERGVRQEERVIMALPDGADFVGALFGILKLGAVVVMINPALESDALVSMFDYSRARLVIVDDDAGGAFSAARAQSAARPDLLSISEVAEEDSDTSGFPAVATHRDDPAIWLFSGGTTGLPKAVVQTHRAFANTTELYAKAALGYSPDDITLSIPKLYFGYATGSNLLFPFSVGASAVLFPQHPTADLLFEQIERHQPTILINVPTMINKMVNHPKAADQDLSSLRFATSAGEALPVPLYHRWKEAFGIELLDGLGTAEMWHIFVTNRPGHTRPGTLGQPVEGFEVKVADDDGNEMPRGEIGKLWVRGDSRAISYWQNIDKTSESFRGSWFVGGDLVQQDEEGYITYCGRGDDVLKVAGKWLVPQEVESCLAAHSAVDECAVVGIETEEGLTKPIAFVSLKAGQAATEDELKQHVLDRLDAYKHPRRVVLVDDMPRTHLGKIDRGQLKGRVQL